jgi:uncharacterized protein YcfJ
MHEQRVYMDERVGAHSRKATVRRDLSFASWSLRSIPDSSTRKVRVVDKSMVKGVVIGGIAMVVLAAGGVTGYRTMTKPTFAEVVAVKEAKETITTPQEKCEQVQVQKQAPIKDEHRATGTIIGGVAGGLLGSAIGGGKGKTVATVAGAAAGAYGGQASAEEYAGEGRLDVDRGPLSDSQCTLGEARGLRRDLPTRWQGRYGTYVLQSRKADPSAGRTAGAEPG